MATIKAEVQGGREIVARLEGLKQSLQSKIQRKAITKALTLVTRAAKRNARQMLRHPGWEPTGGTSLSIGKVIRTYPSGAVLGVVGPLAGKTYQPAIKRKYRHHPAVIAHLIEKGHGGPATAPPYPFLSDAWKQTVARVNATVVDVVSVEIKKFGK